MDINDNVLNELFKMTKIIVNNDLKRNNYNSDINHLLYIIIPAFIIRYNIKNQNKIINTFKEVPIVLFEKEDRVHQAYYVSIPSITNNKIKTRKYIGINHYANANIQT